MKSRIQRSSAECTGMIPDKPKGLEQAKQTDAKSGKFRKMQIRFNTANVKNTEARYKLADLLAQCNPKAPAQRTQLPGI